MKIFRAFILAALTGIYAIWVYTGPMADLEVQYGDSGLTWAILVFGLMIPYGVYFIFKLVWPQKKNGTSSGQDEGKSD